MKNIFKRYAWLKLVEGILLILVGVLVAVLGGINPIEYERGISITVAVFLFLDGALSFGTAVADAKSKFSVNIITGSLLIAIGVVLCVNQLKLNDFLPYFVASVLLAIGLGEIMKGIVQIVQKEKIIWVLINFLIALVAISLGALCIIFINDTVRNIIYIILGIAIVVLATAEIVLAIVSIKENHRKKNEQEERPQKVVVADAEIVARPKEPKQIEKKKK